MYRLIVTLPADRTKLGGAVLDSEAITGLGTYTCLGKADEAMAKLHCNALRDPVLPYGDTPLGEYIGTVVPASVDVEGYGPNKRILLSPVSGQCLQAEKNGRLGLMCHGGALNVEYSQWQGLRPTFGCLRFHDADMAVLIEYVDQANTTLKVSIQEETVPIT
jgi:hypothetical protein